MYYSVGQIINIYTHNVVKKKQKCKLSQKRKVSVLSVYFNEHRLAAHILHLFSFSFISFPVSFNKGFLKILEGGFSVFVSCV